ncbi:hypothetical protein A7985_16410 [Pseudoalteromonas luteoviolacea]|uniref:Uncharacterized protein n=1 Tax=Pseudoalteromonas luteoviolacea TaxID=43657 RepID=A0A1C0TP03_9GAMM|nr:hypothetical protein [Pseudoalteromonas luteoviolacea]MBQ4813523.1 hypothetical protein [Pseudoalteromonas luteoviolacea]OCQ20612.1 hypothetical protein A7985_16410 [Pseudoalteromonas luteoviolacea]
MKFFLISALMAFISFSSFAASPERFNSKISAVLANSDGDVLIQVEGVNEWLSLGKADNPKTQAMMSIALAAKASGASEMWVRWTTNIDPNHHPKYKKVMIMSYNH